MVFVAMTLLPRFQIILAITACAVAAEPGSNRLLADYFAREVATIEAQPLPLPGTSEEWETQRIGLRRQLAEMLGLEPMPPRTPLQATATGEVAVDGIVIETLHYQSMPGLYVTANLYRPAKPEGRLPAILYVCGHSDVKAKDGTSLGNKTHYQHHGAWFARHGYVCLVIDTVQLGEIRGEHHGTYSKGRWWWISRGYTPAGVEAWAGIRGIDYLVSRDDVDASRIGVTGRSGGGAYSWWVAALDDRVKVAAPTAGITTLRNHVVDGCVEGHCDCMFMVNTHRWDYDRVAALLAPRPLLISNTDKDSIFPLDGVVSIYNQTRRLYKALGAEAKIGLQISEGPHKDTQSLNVGAFAWFERWLKGVDSMATFDDAARQVIEPEKLRVFTTLPADERNTRIDAEFVPAASAEVPANASEWNQGRDRWMAALRREVFAGWPQEAAPLALREAGRAEHDGVVMHAWDFTPQAPFTLRLWVAHSAGTARDQLQLVVLNVLDEAGWRAFAQRMAGHFPALFDEKARAGADGAGFAEERKMFAAQPWAMAYVAPRGVGPSAWSGSPKQQAHYLRRFYLLGQTLDAMQTYDIRRAIAALRATDFAQPPLWLQGDGVMGVNALYASLFEPRIARLDLHQPPASHAAGPTYLNVLKHLDVPQAAAMAAGNGNVRIYTNDRASWEFTRATAERLGWDKTFELRAPAIAE
jgi:dienelactone hydrolase